jgi:hypothetical protein
LLGAGTVHHINSVILRRKKASLVHFDGQRLGRLEIEDELEFRCALNREFGRLSAFETFVREEDRVAR